MSSYVTQLKSASILISTFKAEVGTLAISISSTAIFLNNYPFQEKASPDFFAPQASLLHFLPKACNERRRGVELIDDKGQ